MVRLIGEALAELDELGRRKADKAGFAGAFPVEALAGVLRRRLDDPSTATEGPVLFRLITEI